MISRTTCFFFLVCILIAALSVDADKPNIVVILADDLGYGDVQPLNDESKIPTPNFNRLAKEGMTFTDAHSASAVCTPTRYALLCGRYPWRSRMKRGVLGGYSKPLIEKDRQTIATVMKLAGYQTGCIGKWHLGLGWQWKEEEPSDINNMGIAGGKAGQVDYSKPITHGPKTLGFDYSFLVPASLDMSPYAYVKNNRVTEIPKNIIKANKFPAFYRKGEIAEDFLMEDALDKLTNEACNFIAKSASQGKPFLLYFPLTAPHKPVLPHSRFRKSTKLGDYGDFIHQVDWTIGQVLETLDAEKCADNTLLIVTSDNGSFMYRQSKTKDHLDDPKIQGFQPDHHTSNGPWRGTKADIWEAGHRVPFFVRWPGKVQPGTKCKDLVCQTDILATAAEVAGVEFDRESAEDSFSFFQSLQGKSRDRKPVIHQSGSGHLAIRDGDWKLVLGNGSGGREKPRGKAFEQPFQLFNLADDPSEEKDLIQSESDLAQQMQQEFEEISRGQHLSKK